MRIVGFKTKKIYCEKMNDLSKDLKISNKIDIKKIEKIKTEEMKLSFLEIDFISEVDYSPNLAKIEIGGAVLLEVENDKAKEILDSWKNKKVHPQFKIDLFNIILRKTSVKALELEEDVGLPYHIPFPIVKDNSEDKNKK